MSSASQHIRAVSQTGAAALQRGDFATAQRCFEEVVASGHADASVWVALAVVHQGSRRPTAMITAIDQALELEPQNLRALIMKGDLLASGGNSRAAVPFYDLALAVGARMKQAPPSIAQALQRIEAERNGITSAIEAHLRRELAASGYDARTSSARFTQALDILSGSKERYVQQPRAFFFPELPAIQFHPREMFPWLDAVESATGDIRAELLQVLEHENAFVPYIQHTQHAPIDPRHSLLENRDWSAFFLWKDGAPIADNVSRCPKTMAALESVPLVRIKARSPSILFSRLRPGAHIAPHTGFLNTRLICHLPLIVPPGCRFRVGNEVRVWEEGKAWVFDDTIEHEASNDSDHDRVVLIFDVWRPDLTEEEHSLVARLLEAVDTYGGAAAPSWSA